MRLLSLSSCRGYGEGNHIRERAAPAYPAEAKSERIAGVVVVRVLVKASGRPVKACAVSGPVPLRSAAEDAALRFRFVTPLLNGKPIPFVVQKLVFEFKLPDAPPVQE